MDTSYDVDQVVGWQEKIFSRSELDFYSRSRESDFEGDVLKRKFYHDVLSQQLSRASSSPGTLWFQLEDMFQLIVTPQGNEKVTIQFIDTPTKVYAIGARLFLSEVPLPTTFEFEPSRQKVRLRDHATFLPVDHISTCYECFDSLTSLYFLFPSVENLSPS